MRRIALITLAAALLSGCAISTPFRRVTPPDVALPSTMAVSVTYASVRADRRADFDDYTRRVLATLPGQPGLIGWSVRRQIIGHEVWTMTVWQDEASRARFVDSPAHRAAIASALPMVERVRFARLQLGPGDLPLGWPQALAALDAAGRAYPAPARPDSPAP